MDVNFEWDKKSWLLSEKTKNTEKKWDQNLPSIGIKHLKKRNQTKPQCNPIWETNTNSPKCSIQNDSK